MADLQDKVVIVTGAAGGIGTETALALAEAGARVVLSDLPGTALDDGVKALADKGHDVAGHAADITDEASVKALIGFAVQHYGRIDGLDNNAGATSFVGQDTTVTEISTELWDQIMAINARGTMLMSKHALPVMLGSGGGSIVNIASGLALSGDLGNVAYSASKAAVIALTRHIATAFGEAGIRCNAIAPGLVLTPALEGAMPPPVQDVFKNSMLVPRLGQPRDIADAVVFLLSDRSSYITGQVLPIDGGFLAHVPVVADFKALMAQMQS